MSNMSLFVQLGLKSEKFQQGLKNMTRQTKQATQKIQNSTRDVDSGLASNVKSTGALQGAMMKLGGVVAATFAADKIISFAKDSIAAATDLNETMSKVGEIFQSSAEEIFKWSEDSATALGISQTAALDAAATFAVFGKSAGLAGTDLTQFSAKLVNLSADFASFYNTSPEEAITAIGAALRGESEPIRRYGILLDEATLRQRALAEGIVSTTKEALTPQQRVLAAQAEIFAQAGDAQGDFARTSDGLANQQRILEAQLQNLSATIGQELLPVVLELTKALNGNLGEIVEFAKTVYDVLPVFRPFKTLWGLITSGQEDAQVAFEATEKSIRTLAAEVDKFTGIDNESLLNLIESIKEQGTLIGRTALPQLEKLYEMLSKGVDQPEIVQTESINNLESMKSELAALNEQLLKIPVGTRAFEAMKLQVAQLSAEIKELSNLPETFADIKPIDLGEMDTDGIDEIGQSVSALTNGLVINEAAIARSQESTKKLIEGLKETGDTASMAGLRIAGLLTPALGGFFETILTGGQDAFGALVDGIKNLIVQLAQAVAQALLLSAIFTVINPTGSIAKMGVGGIFKGLMGFANGGVPPVGRPSIVGEQGPELFVPSTRGTVIPNHMLGGGGGEVTFRIEGSQLVGVLNREGKRMGRV